MARVHATEIRAGNWTGIDNRMWRVLKSEHVYVGGSASMQVTETGPRLKNATATSSFKPARVEAGITVMVLSFVNQGEKIGVDTGCGDYVARV